MDTHAGWDHPVAIPQVLQGCDEAKAVVGDFADSERFLYYRVLDANMIEPV
jgi:hypothetical protein